MECIGVYVLARAEVDTILATHALSRSHNHFWNCTLPLQLGFLEQPSYPLKLFEDPDDLSIPAIVTTHLIYDWKQHWELAQDAHKRTNIQHLHDEALIFAIHEHLQFHELQYKLKTQIHHTHYTNIQHAKAKQHYL